jgi:hypothetical protein
MFQQIDEHTPYDKSIFMCVDIFELWRCELPWFDSLICFFRMERYIIHVIVCIVNNRLQKPSAIIVGSDDIESEITLHFS